MQKSKELIICACRKIDVLFNQWRRVCSMKNCKELLSKDASLLGKFFSQRILTLKFGLLFGTNNYLLKQSDVMAISTIADCRCSTSLYHKLATWNFFIVSRELVAFLKLTSMWVYQTGSNSLFGLFRFNPSIALRIIDENEIHPHKNVRLLCSVICNAKTLSIQ